MSGPFSVQFSLVVMLLTGCASTTVVRNPGCDDDGIRFYRPKQYLLIEPAAAAGHVKMSTTVLPDYNEEYSIHIKPGLGTNNTSFKLTDGWNLGEMHVDVDSKATEMIGAVAEAAKAGAAFADAGTGESNTASGPAMEMTIPARGVPMGLYEAVVGRDDFGRRQLFGWRYIGFMPFAQCPTDGSGGPMLHDCNCELWGLVWEDGIMVFSSLGNLQNIPVNGDVVRGPEKRAAQPKGATGAPVRNEVKDAEKA